MQVMMPLRRQVAITVGDMTSRCVTLSGEKKNIYVYVYIHIHNINDLLLDDLICVATYAAPYIVALRSERLLHRSPLRPRRFS